MVCIKITGCSLLFVIINLSIFVVLVLVLPGEEKLAMNHYYAGPEGARVKVSPLVFVLRGYKA